MGACCATIKFCRTLIETPNIYAMFQIALLFRHD